MDPLLVKAAILDEGSILDCKAPQSILIDVTHKPIVQTVTVNTVYCRSVGAKRPYFTVLFTFSRPKHPYRPVPSTGGSRGHSVLLLYRYRIIPYCLCREVSETLPCTACMYIARNLHEEARCKYEPPGFSLPNCIYKCNINEAPYLI